VENTAPAIFELGLLLLLAALAGWAARRAGLPAVVGYLAVGLAVSPFTPGYVADRHQVAVLADVGVVLLLFEVGIEIDPLRLRRERGRLLILAPLQVLLGAAAAAAALLLSGLAPAGAGLIGLSIALSSSVVIVNITRSRRRTTDRPTEETLLAWSVLQDLFGVLLAIVLLLVFGFASRPAPVALAGLLAYLLLAIASAWAIPHVLRRLRGEHDHFLLISVATGLAVAGVGARFFGVPLALAAFIAGLAISEGPDTAEARRRLLPFRDLFAVMFFVAIGTLIDPAALPAALPWVLLLLGLILATKSLPTYVLARLGRLPVRRLQLTVGLSQVGEFGFVLASIGLGRGVVSAELYTALLAVVAVSIALSAVLVRAFPRPAALATPTA
jgi:monovalent cation:H+ antiporter-2, CPA2 family